jgi:AbrB family looped-hinge helix DNA binding protein
MTSVAISPKFQIVIPKVVRESLKLVAGQRMDAQVRDGEVVLRPYVEMQSLRGLCTGINTDVPNDPEEL